MNALPREPDAMGEGLLALHTIYEGAAERLRAGRPQPRGNGAAHRPLTSPYALSPRTLAPLIHTDNAGAL